LGPEQWKEFGLNSEKELNVSRTDRTRKGERYNRERENSRDGTGENSRGKHRDSFIQNMPSPITPASYRLSSNYPATP